MALAVPPACYGAGQGLDPSHPSANAHFLARPFEHPDRGPDVLSGPTQSSSS